MTLPAHAPIPIACQLRLLFLLLLLGKRRQAHIQITALLDILALDQIHDMFSDVLTVIANPFQRLDDENHVDRMTDGPLILHHVGDQPPQR